MRFSRLALMAAMLSPVLMSPAFARGGGGGHAGGGGHGSGGGHAVAGGFRGSPSGGFRGGVVNRGYYYGGRFYSGPSLYFGVGAYPGYGYYGYNPYYYGYDPYAYSGYPAYPAYPTQPAAPPQDYGYQYPQQGQGQPIPPPQSQVQPQSSSANNQGNFYLIAFTDHTIQAATAYKVEDGQIHWITRDGQERQAPLSSVDIGFSKQVNADRHVDFQIP